ncbi:MAG: SRPBCC family protein [bacterium]
MHNHLITDIEERELIISRLVNAPRELVFQVWTDVKHLENWWGPNGFSTTTSEFDFREGGVWFHTMHGPDGTDFPNEVFFEKIIPPERIEYEHGGGDDVGVTDAAFHATITFEEQDGKTLVTMKSVFQTAKQLRHVVEKYGAIEGGHQHLARLEEYVRNFILARD